jgi:Protein-L-isoaspartate(D-aspartate) O-methyltransferase (PCMT)
LGVDRFGTRAVSTRPPVARSRTGPRAHTRAAPRGRSPAPCGARPCGAGRARSPLAAGPRRGTIDPRPREGRGGQTAGRRWPRSAPPARSGGSGRAGRSEPGTTPWRGFPRGDEASFGDVAPAGAHPRGSLRTLRAAGIHAERLLDAFRTVPRAAFVPPEARHRAYEDVPLPIRWLRSGWFGPRDCSYPVGLLVSIASCLC